MPPASLSTLAVMNPGPTTAMKTASRLRHPLRNSLTGASIAVPQHRDHVVRGDDAGDAAVFVDDREGDEVVLVEQGGDLALRRVGRAGDIRFAQRRQLRCGRRGGDLDQR